MSSEFRGNKEERYAGDDAVRPEFGSPPLEFDELDADVWVLHQYLIGCGVATHGCMPLRPRRCGSAIGTTSTRPAVATLTPAPTAGITMAEPTRWSLAHAKLHNRAHPSGRRR
jgi:hypothetical protein